MRIAITGATGYIGQRLIRAAHLSGYEVLALSRSPVISQNVKWQFYDLTNNNPLLLPADIAAVYHLAAETDYVLRSELIEQTAAELLVDASKAIGAIFIFISSQTARSDAPTAYGRVKWKIEHLTLENGGIVVRPGQVYGGPERGLFGLLCTLVRTLPILPAFTPKPLVQPIHVDDLVNALLKSIQLPTPTILCLGAPQAIGFTEFLLAVARARSGRGLLVIPMPTYFIRLMHRLLWKNLRAKFGLDRLVSLFDLRKMSTAVDLQRVSIKLRPLGAGVSRSGTWRRELLCESYTFLTYVLREPPNSTIMRRYVRALETLKAGRVLALPAFTHRAPAILALFEGSQVTNQEFNVEFYWRLDAALMLAEASPQGAERFIGINKKRGVFHDSFFIARAVLMEICRRLAQFLLKPFLKKIGQQGVFK